MEAGLARNKRSRDTAGERQVAALLRATGLEVSTSVRVGRWSVDLLIASRIVVKVFGEYWHCSPDLFAPEDYNESLGCTAADKWAKDFARARSLTALGYRVWIVWEGELRKPERVRQFIRNITNEAR